jgi:hypothetical protein
MIRGQWACNPISFIELDGHRLPDEDLRERCCSCCDRVGSWRTGAMRTRRPRSAAVARSAFAGFCFPPEVIVLAVRW